MLNVRMDETQRRRFNPERDLVWALPRLIAAGLNELGPMADTAEQAKKLGLAVDEEAMQQFVRALADFTSAAVSPTPDIPPKEALQKLYELPAAARLLAFHSILSKILAEFPVWCQQLRADVDPKMERIPDLEAVERIRDEWLDSANNS